MPPRRPNQRPIMTRPRVNDPTVSIAAASAARTMDIGTNPDQNVEQKKENQNDDLKKLIESLKNKLGGNTNTTSQKKAPPLPKAKTVWNRSTVKNWKPAYTILSRISNHEKVPTRSLKQPDLTINALPHSFLYKPGADGIKVENLNIKAGRQVGIA